jgi:hypothetical protein
VEMKIFTLAAMTSRNVANSRKYLIDKKLLLRALRIRKRALQVKNILSQPIVQPFSPIVFSISLKLAVLLCA